VNLCKSVFSSASAVNGCSGRAAVTSALSRDVTAADHGNKLVQSFGRALIL
jgi:hypothetical protein